jgi:transcriptional regulator with XRE-family HTH domain
MQNLKAGKVIGANIRRVRKATGLTQSELATQLQLKGLDLSRSTVAKIESGIRHITLDELKVIKTVLDMEYGDFFED